jgi:4-hydroxybenzoyl-CoA reductase subunit beta
MLLPPHEFAKPDSLAEGLDLLQRQGSDALVMGGGTDVIYNMRCRLFQPAVVLSVRSLPELSGVTALADGSIRIGAASRLTDLVAHPVLASRYPALVDAVQAVASRHVRNMATLGGNLCLDTRCWYTNQTEQWRATHGPCLKTGKDVCHVIQGSPTCVAINNADTPPLLMALDASVTLARAGAERTVPLRQFYRDDGVRHTVMTPAEVMVSVTIPPTRDRVVFIKNTSRQGMDFAYGTVAARADGQGHQASCCTVVLGSLTTAPLLLQSPALGPDGLGDAAIDTLCESLRDQLGAVTNLYSPAAFKRDLARSLVRQALKRLREM